MIVLTLVWPVVQPLQLQSADFYWDSDATDVGNAIDGTGLGGNGTWDLATANWWPVPAGADVTYGNGITDRAIFSGSEASSLLQTAVNVAAPLNANRMTFNRSGYTLSGSAITLSDGTPSINVNFAETATINNVLAGTGGLTKIGGGTIRLGGANTYTGTTTISNGSVLISNGAALGLDGSTVLVNGSATRAFGGGALVLEGTSGGVGVNLARNLSLQGLGVNTDRGSALQSVRNNTVTGLVSSGVNALTTRINSVGGTLTLAGGLDVGGTALTTVNQFGSVNSGGVSTTVISGPLSGAGILEKNGTGTLILSPSSSTGFSGTVRTATSSAALGSSSSVRIVSPGVLGTRVATTTGSVLDLNGGGLEVRMDAPSILAGGAPANVYQRAQNVSLFVDHSIGGNGAINQTATFGALTFDVGNTFTFNGRNGYGATFAAVPVNTATGSQTFTNNLNGNLTFTGNLWTTTDNAASRTMTIGGTGNTILGGNLLATAAAFNHNLTKTGTGTLTITSTGATLDGNINISQGALTITDFRSINAASNATINIGGTTNAGTLNFGTTTASTAAGLTANASTTLNLAGTTGGAIINANQALASPVILNNLITATGVGNKTVTLGGTSTQSNVVNRGFINNSVGNSTSLVKADAGTWVLAGNNTYTGSTTVTGGILELKASIAASDIVTNASSIVLDTNAATQFAGGTLQFRGLGNATTTETLGNFTANNGGASINILGGTAGNSTNLIFAANAPAGKGSGVNFVTSTGNGGNISFTGVGASTATTLLGNGHFYVNGNDFARTNAAGAVVVPVYGTDAGFVNANATTQLVGGNHNLVIANIAAQPAVSVTSLKMTNNTLALADLLTVNTNGVANDGGILVNGNSTISGAGITTGGAGTLVFRSPAATSTLSLLAPMTSNTTGGFTKNGAGVLLLGNTNSQTGATTINEGTVRLGSGNATLSANNQNLVIRQNGTFDLNGFNSNNSIQNFNGAGRVTNGGNNTVSILQVGNSNGTGTFTGVIQDGNGTVRVIKVGTGGQTWGGLNTFTGNTTIGSTGLVSANTLANIGQASSIGAGNATDNAGSLVFNGSTGGISYIGSNSVSTDRLFTLDGTGARIENNSANGSGVVFSNTGAIAFGPGAVTSQILTLGGTTVAGDSLFNSQITDNGAFQTNVLKANAGIWQLGNPTNSYTGNTTITAGVLEATSGTSLPTASNLILNGGIFQSAGNFTRTVGTGSNQVNWTPNASGGFSASTGKLNVNLGGTQTWGSTPGFIGTGNLVLSSRTALDEVNIVSGIEITKGIDSAISVNTTAGSATVNLFTGTTAGLTIGQAITGNPNIPGNVTIATITGPTSFTLSSGTGVLLGAGNATNVLAGGVRQIQVDDNTNTGTDFATVSGAISGNGSLNKIGAGMLQLTGASSYEGNTTISGGTLIVTSLGNSAVPGGTSSVGTTTNANTAEHAVRIGTGATAAALQYVGPGETSDRKIQLNTTTASTQIFADGSGPLILTNVSNDLVAVAGSNKTLSLRGSNSANNMITSILSDGPTAPSILNVTADGSATWILSGANTYTGATTSGAGPLGIGSATAFGTGTVNVGGGILFSYGSDRVIANSIAHANNTTAGFIGDYSVGLAGNYVSASGANPNAITNNIAIGKNLTLGNMTFNALTANRVQTFNGSGDTIINGTVTTTTAFVPTFTISGTGNGLGSVQFNGALTALANSTITIANGMAKLGAPNVIPDGTTAVGTSVSLTPVVGQTATFNLNGFNETINNLTATSVGAAVIDNTSPIAATLTFGAGNGTSSIGAPLGTVAIQNSGGGALSLAKIGTGTANIAGAGVTTTYTGATTVNGGTLNISSAVATTAVNVGTNGTLKLIGGFTTPATLTSVVVEGTPGLAFTGGTLSFASGSGTPFNNLGNLTLGSPAANTYLELDAGDSGTDTLTTTNPAVVNGNIKLFVKDIDLTAGNTYNLLVAPSGLTSLAPVYSLSLAGYSGSTLSTADGLVSLNVGTLVTSDNYWSGTATGPGNSTMWSAIDGGGLTNFSTDVAGTTVATTLPGSGQKVVFQADTIAAGGIALNTTLEQDFKINSLIFQPSTVLGNTSNTINIAPGLNASAKLTIAPSNSADGISLNTTAVSQVVVSSGLGATKAQTWNVSDAVGLAGGITNLNNTTISVASTAGLRPGMTITGTNIAAGTTILSITNGTDFVLSGNAAGNATGLNFAAQQQLTVSGALTGNGAITKIGAGKVLLSAGTTGFTGSYNANGGITEITNVAALNGLAATAGMGAPISIGSNGTFYYNGAAGTVSNNLTLNGGTLSAGTANQIYSGTVNVSAASTILMRDSANLAVNATARNITIPSVLSGAGKLIIDGSSTLASGNANTGTLTLTGNNSAWSGGIDFIRGTVTANASNGSNGTGPISFKGVAAHYTGNASQQGGRLILQGLAGTTTTYNSPLNYESATVGEFQADNISAALTSNYVVNQNGTVNLGTVGGNGTGATARIFLADTSSTVNFNGGVVLNGSSSLTVAGGGTVVGNTSLLSINGTGISESVAGSKLDINDELGVWGTTSNRIAINAAGTYTGGTTLNEGTLILGNTNALGTGLFTITGASTLEGGIDLSGGAAIPNALNLNNTFSIIGNNHVTFSNVVNANGGNASRTLNNNLGPAGKTLTFANTVNLGSSGNLQGFTLTLAGNGTTQIAGLVQDGNGFANGLTVTNTGLTTLSNANTYAGATTMNAATGTLLIQGSNSSAGNTTLTTGKLQLDGTSNGGLASGLLSLNGGTIEALTSAKVLTNNALVGGSFGVIGNQSLTISGLTIQSLGNRVITNTQTAGFFRIDNLALSENATARTLTLAGNGTTSIGTITNNGANNTITNSMTGASPLITDGPIYLSENATVGRTLTLAGNATTLLSGLIQDVQGGPGAPGGLTVTNTNVTTLTNANTYSGTTTMNAAAGTLLIQGSNSSAGNTTLTTGKLQLDGTSNGGLASGLLSLNGGTIEALTSAKVLTNNALVGGSFGVIGNQSLTISGLTIQSLGNRVITNTQTAGFFRIDNLALSENATARTLTLAGNGTTSIGTITNNGANNTITNSMTGASPLITDGPIYLSENATIGRTLTLGGAGNTTVTNVIDNVAGGPGAAGGLTKTGAGTLSLPTTNLYTGTTTIVAGSAVNQGVIVASANNALGTGNVTAQFNTGALSSQVQLVGNITLGNGIFSTTGAGNSTNGVSGIIRSVSGDNVITGSLNLIGGGGDSTYRADTSASLTVNGNVGSAAANTDRTMFLVGGGNFTFAGSGILRDSNLAVPGTERLNVNSGNTGTTTLNGINTYTGTTTVGANSTLIAGSTQAFGIGSNATVTGTMRLAGNSNSIGSLAGNGTVENANVVASTLATGNAGNTTFSGTLQDGVGGGALSLNKTGAGIFTVSGNNTYTGTTLVTAGTLVAGSTQAFGVGSGTTVIGGLQLNGNNNTIGSLAGNGIVENANVVAAMLTTGNVGNTTFSGTLQNGAGGGALSLNKVGVGDFTVSGNNTYTGTTTVAVGKLIAGSTSAFGVSSATTVATPGVMQLAGFNNSIGSLAGNGIVENANATAATLTTGIAGNTTFSGNLQNGIGGGALTLNKVGPSTFELSGTNSFTGGTNVAGGVLLINGDSSAATGPITVAAGASIGGTGSYGGGTTISGELTPGNSPGALTFGSSLTLDATSTFTWQLISNTSSDTTGIAGTDFDAVNTTGLLTISPNASSVLNFNSGISTVNFNNVFWTADHSWLVFNNAIAAAAGPYFGSIAVSNDSLNNPSSVLPGIFSWAASGDNVVLNYTAVPEPSSILLTVLGLVGFGLRRSRKSRKDEKLS